MERFENLHQRLNDKSRKTCYTEVSKVRKEPLKMAIVSRISMQFTLPVLPEREDRCLPCLHSMKMETPRPRKLR